VAFDSRPEWAQQWEAATKVLDDAGVIHGALHKRVAALVTAAKEAAERLQAAEAESEDNDAAWQGARDRASRLRAERDTAIRERAEMATERDNCREVLRKEREERAAEKSAMGAALASLRAEVNTLGETVERMTAENARLVAQLEVVERILTSALRGAK
jgi:chromosome segregation ATPase